MDESRKWTLPHQIWNFSPEQGSVSRNFGADRGAILLGKATSVLQTYCQRRSCYSGPPSLDLVWSLDNRSLDLKCTEKSYCSGSSVLMALLSSDAG